MFLLYGPDIFHHVIKNASLAYEEIHHSSQTKESNVDVWCEASWTHSSPLHTGSNINFSRWPELSPLNTLTHTKHKMTHMQPEEKCGQSSGLDWETERARERERAGYDKRPTRERRSWKPKSVHHFYDCGCESHACVCVRMVDKTRICVR